MREQAADNLREVLEVATATPDDGAAICGLFYAGVDEGQVRDNDTGADIENLQAGYFSDEGASGFWVARHDGRVIGMIGVQKTSRDIAEIRRLRVDDRYRRRGVGTRLMETAIQFCRSKGYLKVVLDVQVDRAPAIALFEKFGFKLARTREISKRKMLDFLLDLYSEQER
jgi:ribosomal protein S18 acetylase RimI-like enzyme